MDKVLIDIFLPAINRSFEVYIPLDSKFYEITPLVSNYLTDYLFQVMIQFYMKEKPEIY